MANFLSKMLDSGAGSLVEAVGTALDKVTTSDEERKALDNELAKAQMQHEATMASLQLQETQSFLVDTQSARQEQTKVQDSAQASWLAKNVQPILSLAIIGITFWLYYTIIFTGNSVISAPDSPMKDIVIYILGALTTVSTQVVSYFFGSSQGSADKNKALMEAAKRP